MSDSAVASVVLRPGREKSLLRRHPWLFEGAIARVMGQPQLGETVQVRSAKDEPLGLGSFSPRSQIRVRMWTYEPETVVDAAWFDRQLDRAIAARAQLLSDPQQTACRLVAAESDGLPGIVVDRYADVLVCQFLTAGADYWGDVVAEWLSRRFPDCIIYERSDVDVRQKEGLPLRTGLLHGEDPPELIKIQEGNLHLLVDVRAGHKTGFYLDQRDNRAIAAQFCRDRQVLNCFSYTGGFSLAALAAGASHVLNMDASAFALELSERNHQLNQLDPAQYDHVEGDVFRLLRQFRDEARQFDVIVLDPPKFVESQANLQKAARGYKDINRLAFLLLRPGGVLITFSCSGLMPTDLFQKIVADAALDAHCEAQLIHRLGQAADHPTLLSFPESTYLKGFVCRVMG
ncbi:class I SAM-dependent rRNA methyltransferase [Leptolyngbya sp. AN02str]|uniref:class I SAM-dependent rRNA methyltransferase n=1 Tax=Leptolyngbya sp. AN02str TaxID=3423363 RepID=UPI003D3179F6